MEITKETRRQSHEKTNRTVVTVSLEIYNVLFQQGAWTAWELAGITGREVYTIRPRLTELREAGKIKKAGSRWCESTQRNETVWEVVDKQMKFA